MSALLCRCTVAANASTFQHLGVTKTDTDLVLLFRGYLANREDLRHVFGLDATVDDAEIVTAAFRRWGTSAAQHLLGEFAAILYDQSHRYLLLMHDELGLVPLYYTVQRPSPERTVIYAAPFLEDLIAETGIGELDSEYIADYIALGQHLGERTPYTHIKRLCPGESLSFSNGVMQRHNQWTLTRVAPWTNDMDSEAQHALRETVRSAVRGSLPRAGNTWCELSGGLDSSTVLAFAAQVDPSIEAVSFLSANRDADESSWMRMVLDQYPVTWNPIPVDAHKPFSELPQGPIAHPSPSILTPEIHRIYAQQLERHNVDTVLTGQVGDAVFLGLGTGPYYLADMLRRGQWRSLLTHLQKWQSFPESPRPLSYWFRRYALMPAIRSAQGHMVEDLVVQRAPIPWVTADFDRTLSLADRTRRSFAPPMQSIASTNLIEGVLRCANSNATFYNRPQILTSFRHPLFFLPLLKLTLSMPFHETVQPHGHRLLQRRSLYGILPAELLARQDKSGADQSYYDGLEEGAAWQDLLLRNPEIVRRGYVDATRWLETIRIARLGGNVELRFLIAFASLEGWLRSLPRFVHQTRFPHPSSEDPQHQARQAPKSCQPPQPLQNSQNPH